MWDTGDGRLRFVMNDGNIIGLLRPTEELDDVALGNAGIGLCPSGAGWFEGPLIDGGGFGYPQCSDWSYVCVRLHQDALEVHYRPVARGPNQRRCQEDIAGERHVRKDPSANLPAETFQSRQSLLSAIATSDTVILKGRWLIEWATSGKPLPRRQELPPGAAWDPSDLVTRLATRGDVPIVAFSYCWKTASHPDPEAEQLRDLAWFIKKRLAVKLIDGANMTRCTPWAHDLAVFVDWCSYYQEPRSDAEHELFKQGLKNVNLWYAHIATETWMMTKTRDGMVPYDDRGWPTFERGISSILTRSHALLDLGACTLDDAAEWGDIWRACRARRRPPMVPSSFCAVLDSKSFTNNADVEMVKGKYTSTFRETLAHKSQMNFTSMGWGDEEAKMVAECLPFCTELSGLALRENDIGPEGGAALLAEIGKCSKLHMVLMEGNPIGDEVLNGFHEWAAKDSRRKIK